MTAKKYLMFFLFLFLPIFPQSKERIAILDFKSILVTEDLGLAVSEILRTKIVELNQYVTVERSLLNQILSEQNLQQTGLIDDRTAVEIGRMSGAKLVVIGSVVKTGSVITLNARAVSVKTGEVSLAKSLSFSSTDQIPEICEKLSLNLSGGVRNKPTANTSSKPTTNTSSKARNLNFIKELVKTKLKNDNYKLNDLVFTRKKSINNYDLHLDKDREWEVVHFAWTKDSKSLYIIYKRRNIGLEMDSKYVKFIISNDLQKINILYHSQIVTCDNAVRGRLKGNFSAKYNSDYSYAFNFYHYVDKIMWGTDRDEKISPLSILSFSTSPSGKYLLIRPWKHYNTHYIISRVTKTHTGFLKEKSDIFQPYRKLEDNIYNNYGSSVAWSPDGKYIAFAIQSVTSRIFSHPIYSKHLISVLAVSLK